MLNYTPNINTGKICNKGATKDFRRQFTYANSAESSLSILQFYMQTQLAGDEPSATMIHQWLTNYLKVKRATYNLPNLKYSKYIKADAPISIPTAEDVKLPE